MSILDKITLLPFPTNQFFDETVPKTQIYIHHTASSPNPYGVLEWWKKTQERVATAFIIAGKPSNNDSWKDGDIFQLFSSNKWAFHLGLKSEHLQVAGKGAKTNIELNKNSIGIEICNWGALNRPTDQGYFSYNGVFVSPLITSGNVTMYHPSKFRGNIYYQAYTAGQLASLKELLQYLCEKWNIPSAYRGNEIFNIDIRALRGEPGIYTHVSVRPDKSDCHPQKELINVLTSL